MDVPIEQTNLSATSENLKSALFLPPCQPVLTIIHNHILSCSKRYVNRLAMAQSSKWVKCRLSYWAKRDRSNWHYTIRVLTELLEEKKLALHYQGVDRVTGRKKKSHMRSLNNQHVVKRFSTTSPSDGKSSLLTEDKEIGNQLLHTGSNLLSHSIHKDWVHRA